MAELTKTETFALTAIAYLQPVTRGEISRLAGREISRDVIAALKRHGLIDGAIRAPQPGAPFAYVTTRKFLEAFGFASLRDLPDLERLKAEGLLQTGQGRMISIARLGWRKRCRIPSAPFLLAQIYHIFLDDNLSRRHELCPSPPCDRMDSENPIKRNDARH